MDNDYNDENAGSLPHNRDGDGQAAGGTEPVEKQGLTEAIEDFSEMGLRDDLLRGIYAYGFERPTPIQQRAIKPLCAVRDTLAQAQSGQGKTGAFTIGTLHTLDLNKRDCQVIILSNTRELAKQTAEVVSGLGQYMNVSSMACIGGQAMRESMEALRRGVQVVVGTPGRVLHMITNGALRTGRVHYLILDEADEMLKEERGEGGSFKDQVHSIFDTLPPSVAVGLFSATMPDEVVALSNKFMREPIRILVKREAVTLAGIKQFYIHVGDREEFKLEVLLDLYETITITQAIVFASSRKRVEWLAAQLNEHDFACSQMHADLDQRERQATMRAFKTGATRILISTDVLARGIDVQQVSLVINFDLPRDRENYIHRIGRAGRNGRKGVAVNFITTDDVRALREIERFYSTEIDEMPKNIAEMIG
mmetsp:Transcript_14816/g.44086  ORF Transcript_14816/g.44086 Transcript_14816/m.44086 type:complete len:422 (+) Transcript_14816:165-1430(+)